MKQVVIGKDFLTIEMIEAIARRECAVTLCDEPSFIRKIESGATFLDEALQEHGGIYGVTTGYGDSCTQVVPPEHYYDLPVNLTRYHGCGMGNHFTPETTRAIIAVRLNTLSQGFSGVSMELLRRIAFLLEHDILPLIPEEGSVGASGDLTPLSYLAAVLIGEREVLYQGKRRLALDVLKELELRPYRFRPKEAIAIMNGTAVMNAVACLAFSKASYLADVACRVTAMNSMALKGNAYHFYERLFEVKPHPGQNLAAAKIREVLASDSEENIVPEKIQDPYSIRCAPHVIGVFYDAEKLFRQLIEVEMNSANDNPIIDPELRSVFHGGHFYGGHIAFAMDSLKNVVANLADLLDRQLAVMVDVKFNRGLPPNLSGSEGKYSYHHGFKAVQIAASAWTAEALKNTMPMSVFSRSTECHNQDKVSMGTIAARDCIRVLELTEQVAAACLLAAAQALRLRVLKKEISREKLKGVEKTYEQLCDSFEFLAEDRPLEHELRETVELIRLKRWSV
ncbi:MAG: aromatic amino acid ammonia-lyase [Fibrobacter sp.]|jgi:histidine ammonia-lyase|nr:aromatic amino acid ammonia-lyase [Fibrobacter sp.]